MNITLRITGMHCPSCETLIKDVLEDEGIKSEISWEKGTAKITFDENKISEEKIHSLISDEGYGVEIQ